MLPYLIGVTVGGVVGWFVRKEVEWAELDQRNREIARAKVYLGYRADRDDSIHSIVRRHCEPGEAIREQAT